jgi:hypothetical protein
VSGSVAHPNLCILFLCSLCTARAFKLPEEPISIQLRIATESHSPDVVLTLTGKVYMHDASNVAYAKSSYVSVCVCVCVCV